MTPTTLVAFATKHGSTRQVAQTIAATLADEGLAVDVKAAADVDDLSRYSGVVLGTALYMGRAHVDARRFLRRHHKALAELPVAVFAMGPLTTSDDDVEGSKRQLDRALAKVSDVAPVSTAIFGGVTDPATLRFPFNQMKLSDARDWSRIESWGREVAGLVAARFAITT